MSRGGLPPGLVSATELSFDEQDALCRGILKREYPHDEIFGDQCPLGAHVDAPYDEVVRYVADVPSLAEWTLNIRHIVARDGLYHGKMVFSVADAAAPTTDIYLRADIQHGREQSLVCFPCAWDQPHDLWMRYFFVVADAAATLGRPGASVMWNNCRHRFYDRQTEPVPDHIERGRRRTDRPWPGDGWPMFYALHKLELENLKAILEHRHAGWR
jgi:hypothetical protein